MNPVITISCTDLKWQDRGTGVWQRRADEWVEWVAKLPTWSPCGQERALDVRKLTNESSWWKMSSFTIIQMIYSSCHLHQPVSLVLSIFYCQFIPFFSPFYILTVLFNLHTKTPSTPSINTLVKSDWCWIFQYGSAYQAAPYDLPGWASERQRFAWRAVEWILYTIIYKWKACLQVHKHMNTRSTPTPICVDESWNPQPINFSLRLAFHLYFSILFE